MANSRFHNYRYEWPQYIPKTHPLTRVRIHALIPNLKHRPERWTRCLKLLEEQGFPRSRIHRVDAFSWKDYPTARDAVEHARQFICPMPRLISESRFITRNDVSQLCWLLTWYSLILRISRTTTRNLYCFVLVDDCFTIFTYAQLHQIVDCVARYEHQTPRIVQISRNPRVQLHRKVVPYFDILQYGLCGRTDAGYLLNRHGARDVLQVCELFPREQIPAYFFEKLSYFPQQQGYFSLSALYENTRCAPGFGGMGIFEARREFQDRMASSENR